MAPAFSNLFSAFNSGHTMDFTIPRNAQGQYRQSSKKEIKSNLSIHDNLILAQPSVQRKATIAQMYFLDYYTNLLTYIHQRKLRLNSLDSNVDMETYLKKERVLLRKRRIKLLSNQFHIITQVGQGGYGEVFMARKINTGEIVALKKMKKSTLSKMGEIRHILVERDILTNAKSDWLVQLLYAFQDEENIFLAMEFIGGGDFRTLLNNSGVLKEEHARFYIAEMFCGVNALHQLGYIHRDLKPENFLVDNTGHVKLTDFGLACGALNPQRIESMKHKLEEVKGKNPIIRPTIDRKNIFQSLRSTAPRTANSCVGSSEYMAPEVLRGKGYSHSVDYWSLGCILFEFLSGYPPFSGANQEESWTNLKNWSTVLKRPEYTKPEDLIFNLTDTAWNAILSLITDAQTRNSTMEEVKRHPFYASVDWDNLRQTTPPFVPQLESETDAGYFDSFTDPADMAKYKDVKEKQKNVEAVRESSEKPNRGIWVGFTYKKPNKKETILEEDDNAFATMF